jgi:hypothetical protein
VASVIYPSNVESLNLLRFIEKSELPPRPNVEERRELVVPAEPVKADRMEEKGRWCWWAAVVKKVVGLGGVRHAAGAPPPLPRSRKPVEERLGVVGMIPSSNTGASGAGRREEEDCITSSKSTVLPFPLPLLFFGRGEGEPGKTIGLAFGGDIVAGSDSSCRTE